MSPAKKWNWCFWPEGVERLSMEEKRWVFSGTPPNRIKNMDALVQCLCSADQKHTSFSISFFGNGFSSFSSSFAYYDPKVVREADSKGKCSFSKSALRNGELEARSNGWIMKFTIIEFWHHNSEKNINMHLAY